MKLLRLLALVLICQFTMAGAAMASEHGSDKGSDGPIFVDSLPIVVSVISQGRVRGQLVVAFSFGVADDKGREMVEQKEVYLRDANLRALAGYATRNVDPRQPIDTGTISSLLQQNVDRLVGPGIAHVYLKAANVQPF